MTAAVARPLTLLTLCGAACLLLAITWPRLNLSYDLGYFLPAPQSSAQALLIERLGQGPGTQLIFVVLPGASEASANSVAIALRKLPGIERVLPEDTAPSVDSVPVAIWQQRLLLTDVPVELAEWQAVLDERLMDSMLADDALLELIAADPLLASVSALESATAAANSPQFHSAKERYLLIQTTGGAFDISAQTRTVNDIRNTLTKVGQEQANLYGSGVYGVDLQATVQRESMFFSILASVALAALMFLRFRSPRLVLAVGVPLIVGGLAGLCALALLFDRVHGITLAFGFTLLGVAIDYPLHLFSHAEQERSRTSNIWPTLSLGIASTLIAYLAFVLSGTAGMRQLGVFAVTGISVAAAAAWLLSSGNAEAANQPAAKYRLHPPKLNQLPWLICAALCAALLQNQTLFSNDLSSMTPIPKATLAADAQLRTQMGVADMRHLVSVRGSTLQGTLESLEAATAQLNQAILAGELGSYQSAASLLPSNARQTERQARLKELVQNGNFERALADSDFDAAAFAGFSEHLKASATSNSRLTPQRLTEQSPELKPLLDSLLYPIKDQWVALVFLQGLSAQPTTLAQSIKTIENAELVDLKAASQELVANYRSRVFALLGGALIAISLLLLLSTRQPQRVLWLLGTLGAALGVSVTAGHFLLGGLSLFDVIALALVAGLGLDYGLFFSKPTSGQQDQHLTTRAITLCAISSLLVFGILGLSEVPLLRGLGVTVASGVAAAYLLARFSRSRQGLGSEALGAE